MGIGLKKHSKYSEMCCENRLPQLKEEYVWNKKVMNPSLEKKLSNLEKLLDLVILSIDPSNVISLFKLLTLDLFPCLTKFILNIFSKQVSTSVKGKEDEIWKNNLIDKLINNNYETIIINTLTITKIKKLLLKLIFKNILLYYHKNHKLS